MRIHKSTTVTRRAILAAGAATAAATAFGKGLFAVGQKRFAQNTLAGLAAKKGLAFGASFAVHELDRDHGDRYAQLYRRDVQLITSELALKIPILRPAAHILNFKPADRLFAFAKDNALGVHGHTLIWDDYLPDWIKQLGPGEVEHLLNAHVLTVLERYKGRAETWDVVNEPIAPWDKNPGNLRQGPFYASMGEAYIAKSFRLAREIEPNATLLLNEAQTESADENGAVFRKSLFELVRRVLDQGVPIDGIGLQCHLQSERPYDFPRFADFVNQIAELGLEVQITELDVNDSAFPAAIATRDRRVATLYHNFLTEVLAIPAVSSLILWQLSDATSWMADPSLSNALRPDKKPSRPLPYDRGFDKKPAWHAIAKALRAMPARPPKAKKL
ncbi:MAG: endo-1,4-beta-xylanase [Alphaproteobacteria bacterium]|nr:endo-1,4-beta-xylanase [Alphaproteobacteria bacterium]